MKTFDHAAASAIIAPSVGDWLFRIKFVDGRVVARRVSPPSLSKEDAQKRVLASLGRDRIHVADIDCWRDGERRQVIA